MSWGCSRTVKCDGRKFTARELADAIIQAAQEVMDRKWDAEFVVDPFQAGAGTSHNMNANEVIANRATQLLGGELGQVLRAPERSCQHGAIHQRRHTRPPSGSARCGGWMSC